MQRILKIAAFVLNCILPLFAVIRKGIFRFLQEVYVLHIYMLKLYFISTLYINVYAFEVIDHYNILII